MEASRGEDILCALNGVDWNFPRATTLRDSINSLHRFPGNFVPDLPAYLIQILSGRGMLVADPFCGSGTAGFEAVRLDRRAYISDVNRAGLLIAKGKVAILTSPIARYLEVFAGEIASGLATHQPGLSSIGNEPRLADWFHSDTLFELRGTWTAIEKVDNEPARDALAMAFTDTLFACASTAGSKTKTGGTRRHHWGWIADNVLPKPPVWQDARRLFCGRIEKLIQVSSSVQGRFQGAPVIRLDDCRSLSIESGTVDLVVTSPPYVGMIDYTMANRLTYLWFGWPLEQDRELEIGARYRRKNSAEPARYLESMELCCSEIGRILKVGGLCAIVIGASRKFPDIAASVIDRFGSSLQLIWGPKARVPERRRVSERKGTEPSEFICVFRKS
jgi:DNA modification methylase